MKFGGTSVGSAARIKAVADLICKERQNLVVLSAMAGTTNTLVEIGGYLYNSNIESANSIISSLEGKYRVHIDGLYSTEEYRNKAWEYVHTVFSQMQAMTSQPFALREEKILLSQGELMSTHMMLYYLQEKGVNAALLPALDYMLIDIMGEPDLRSIRTNLTKLIKQNPDADLYLTQGFICMNTVGEVDNLQRGGSDYTASLVGAAVGAPEIQIWTDIDGMHNNDPRIVEGTKAVRHLHFEEAAELGYFGAKILHPTCIQPAKFANIPVRLLNTMQPDAPGTLINNVPEAGTIKAVAAKDDITAISITSSRMLLAFGFLRKVFEIFETYRTSIDMVCTSEVGVSMSIDDTSHLTEIIQDLKKFGTVKVDRNMCIVCVVGDMDWNNVGFESRAMEALKEVPVRMISFGGSDNNISFLIRRDDKIAALRALSKYLFSEDK